MNRLTAFICAVIVLVLLGLFGEMDYEDARDEEANTKMILDSTNLTPRERREVERSINYLR